MGLLEICPLNAKSFTTHLHLLFAFSTVKSMLYLVAILLDLYARGRASRPDFVRLKCTHVDQFDE